MDEDKKINEVPEEKAEEKKTENEEAANENSAEGEITADAAAPAEATEKVGKAVEKTLKKEIIEWAEALIVAVVVALVIRSFVFTVVRVDGHSMDSTLANNDRLIVWRLGYEPKQGDIIIFAPDIPDNVGRNPFNKIYWVKRVIAVGGQHVEIDYADNAVYVDGEKLDEPYIKEEMVAPASNATISSIDLEEGQVFLMGDNRNSSRDCRYIGPADVDSIVGKAVLRFWPLSSFGGVN